MHTELAYPSVCFMLQVHDKNTPRSSTQWMKIFLRGTCPTDRLGGIVKPQAEVYIRESETIDRLTVDITPSVSLLCG